MGLITLNIKVPETGPVEWGFRGQIIQLSADIKESVSTIKKRISDVLGQMPIKKMKLRSNIHSVFKDEFSLAKYNLTDGAILELAVKERGRRRQG